MKVIIEKFEKEIFEEIGVDFDKIVEWAIADKEGRMLIAPTNKTFDDLEVKIKSDVPTKCTECAHLPVCLYFSKRFKLNLDTECEENCALFL